MIFTIQNVRNKIHEFEHWKIKEDNRRTKSNNFESWESLEPPDPLSRRTFTRGCWQKFRESKESVKKFYGANPSIYRGEGGSFKKPPRFDSCEFSGGRVSTPTFRGWRFLPKFKSFRGNGSSESTRFPEGLVLGNSVKPFTLETSDCRNSWNMFVKQLWEKGSILWKRVIMNKSWRISDVSQVFKQVWK
jgi:hypothetical protein